MTRRRTSPNQLAFDWTPAEVSPPQPRPSLDWAARVLESTDVANDTDADGGYTLEAIATFLGVSVATIHRDVESIAGKLRVGFEQAGVDRDEAAEALREWLSRPPPRPLAVRREQVERRPDGDALT